jgi:hypothetical protein
MADLATGTISAELRADPDYLLYGETVPSNTTVYSDGMALGKTQDAIEIVGVAKTEITVLDTKEISFVIQESSDDGDSDSYVTIATPYSMTASSDTTIDAGTELFRFVPSTKAEVYIRVGFVSTDTGEAGTVDVFPVYKAR